MSVAIETLGLTKTYRSVTGRVVAVDGLDLRVPGTGLHVLLGPAGSGKTTVVRLLLGLARADAGAARVLGVAVPDAGRELAGRVGAVVGEPGFLERLSGRRNLLMHPGATNRAQVDLVLDQVGLADVAREPVGSYPPGARRRLTIAAALLTGPELLIADDATRGLDAACARDVRTFLRKLADRGTAVVLTTDDLTEAQQLADTVTLLSGGAVLADGPAADVIGELATAVRIGVDDAERAVAELTAAKFTATVDGDTIVVDGVADPADVTKALARKKLYVTRMSSRRESLESLVRRLTPAPEPEPVRPTRAEQRAARKEADAEKQAARQARLDQEDARREERELARELEAEEKAARKESRGRESRTGRAKALLGARAAETLGGAGAGREAADVVVGLDDDNDDDNDTGPGGGHDRRPRPKARSTRKRRR